MNIKIFEKPDLKITRSILYFQFRFMEFASEELEYEEDLYGTLPLGYVVAYQNNEIIGVINLYKREITYNNKKLILGGIGYVCTHSKHRRKGVATQLLEKGIITLEKNKCDIAFLNLDEKKLASLYSKIGFVPLNRNFKATGMSGKVYYNDGGMIAPICSNEMFIQVINDVEVFDLQGQCW